MTDDRLSIKNLLFTKAIPNNIIPTPTDGYRIFGCTDCGDRFLFQSSYDTHINRKSIRITYMCRHCGETKHFMNRCKLLSHIRSHTFKTATINVSDLQIEPLPINLLALPMHTVNETNRVNVEKKQKQPTDKHFCHECKEDITVTGVLYKDRAKHYMQCSDKGIVCYTCPVCLFTLPSSCGLRAHLNVHLRKPPYFCPECGIHLPNKSVSYPYSHDCEGFKMIRATTRLKCYNKACEIFHPNEYREHMKSHVKKVYKCPICSFKWIDQPPQTKHSLCNNGDVNIVCYFKCPLCPHRLLTKNQINRHLTKHFEDNVNQFKSQVYPCRTCGIVYDQVQALLIHQVKQHNASKSIIESFFEKSKGEEKNKGNKAIYRVIKRCEKCYRSFTYRCPYESIKVLPTRCPYKCSVNASANIERTQITEKSSHIICFICKYEISEKWEDIKKHFAQFHESIKCVDVKIVLKKLSPRPRRTINKTNKVNQITGKSKIAEESSKGSANNGIGNLIPIRDNVTTSWHCKKCDSKFISKKFLESHMVSHRDPRMAYQCLECGQCFAVKPSFSTHLLLEHGISHVEMYINEKNCFNEFALKNQNISDPVDEPLEENQCRICREKFECQESLEKHFRVHGMAFLMKNSNKTSSP